MKFSTVLFLFVALVSSQLVKAQTADEVIAKYEKAIGGKDKMKEVKSLSMVGKMNLQGGSMKADFSSRTINGKAYRMDINVMGMSISQAVKDTSGWFFNPQTRMVEKMPAEVFNMSKARVNTQSPLFSYKADGAKVEYVGIDDVNEEEAYKLKYTDKENNISYYYIGKDKNFLLKESHTVKFNGTEQPSETTFTDYRKLNNGMYMPFSITTQFGTVLIDKIEINPEIDEKIFDMP